MSLASEKTGKRLATLVAAKGLSMRDLERLSGYYRGHLEEIVKGTRAFDGLAPVLQGRIARALDMTRAQLEEALTQPEPAPEPVVQAVPKAAKKKYRPGPEMTSDGAGPSETF